jgi:hypothetical protein
MRAYLLPILLLSMPLFTVPVQADNWTAVRLRGTVLAGQSSGPWQRLRRGDVVDDDRVIRTLADGMVEFTRGTESISLGPRTQAQIVDRIGRRYTTVVQQSGEVEVNAEARRVLHFAVQTPYLVAVVKGTVFTVTTRARSSRVAVSRGLVAVTDLLRHLTVLVPAGRQVTEGAAGTIEWSGRANPAMTHPVVNGVVEDQGSGGSDGLLGATVDATLSATGEAAGNLLGGAGAAVSSGTDSLGSGLAGGLGSTAGVVSGATDAAGGTVRGTLSRLGL